MRRATKIINAQGKTEAQYTYDAAGNITSETDSEGHTLKHAYDALNRRTKTTHPDGTATEYTWDKLDLARVKDRNGKIVEYRYDAARQPITVTDTLRIVKFGYDAAGRLTSLTDGNGKVTRWQRDLQGRVVGKTTPDGVKTLYEYDSAGRQIKRTDALGQTRIITYDKGNQVTQVAYAGNSTDAVRFIWDAYHPRIVAMKDGTGTTNYRYIPAGQPGALGLAGIEGPQGNYRIDRDASGRVDGWNVGAAGEEYTFDPLGRIAANRNSVLGEFQYSYLGQTRQMIETRLADTPIERRYTYEPNTGDRRLKGIAHPAAARSYAYAAAAGKITRIVETQKGQSREWGYEYDEIGRLQAARRDDGQNYAYTLDAADNLTGITGPESTRTYAHDAGNRIKGYQYDANGNLTEDKSRTYQWDAENRLIGIGYKGTQKKTEFKYDGGNRRIAIVETNGTKKTETRYTWCGNQICAARNEKNEPIAYYFNEGAYRPASNKKEYYARDHLGSIRDVLDEQGNAIARYDYDPYGKLTNTPQTPPEFGYAGMQYHAPSGLYLTKYRAYDPRDGRWLSKDPIEEAGGLNLYAYVGGNPVSFVDPLGLSPYDVKKIQEIIQEEIDRMTRDGERHPTPWWNNTCGSICGYKDCGGQTEAVKNALNKEIRNLDDHWRFDIMDGFGHVWGVAVSSNKNDPKIYFDARANQISIDVPCPACSGLFGGIFDSGELSKPPVTPVPAAPPEIRNPW